MHPEEHSRHGEANNKLPYLDLRDQPLPSGGPAPAEGGGEVVGVHEDVDGGVGEEGEGHEGLAGAEPEVGHDEDEGVVVEVEEGQGFRAPGVEEDEEGVEELVDLGEVVDVGPEEEGAGGGRVDDASVGREAEEVGGGR